MPIGWSEAAYKKIGGSLAQGLQFAKEYKQEIPIAGLERVATNTATLHLLASYSRSS